MNQSRKQVLLNMVANCEAQFEELDRLRRDVELVHQGALTLLSQCDDHPARPHLKIPQPERN